jgi:hypothetical protein
MQRPWHELQVFGQRAFGVYVADLHWGWWLLEEMIMHWRWQWWLMGDLVIWW